ncbi:MAG: hypothetical protein Q8M98_02125 [Candidatus Cloacimonadaceae bacterium]|nr:hypothetical protein [Candidatus Cloacimonadaceae bacterium]MDP3113552.1 hypothetical protein [Candidatus Cloacimonadaceae bacterium]
MYEYLDKIQLIHFFLISYLISRVFVRFMLPQRIVYWLFEEKHVSISRLTWLLISGTALLSIVIANVITLMALVPVLIMIQAEYDGKPSEKRKFNTLVMLAAIWGANIGGMGMLTGTTTNGILVGMFEAYKFPISHSFTFLSWMAWALPLAFILCVVGWLILMLVFRPNHKLSGLNIRQHLSTLEFPLSAQKLCILLAIAFMVSSALLSFSMTFFRTHRPEIYIINSIWTLLFLYIFFLHKFRIFKDREKIVLLTAKDILHDVPKKGLLWILGGILLTLVLVLLKFPESVAGYAVTWIKADYSLLLLLLIIALITTFATELVSNSVIQISMFMTLFPLTKVFPEISWEMMLVISLCSTCAFMSPIATPSNGLGYGSSSKVSLFYMMGAGLLMNLSSAGIITLWVYYVVPIVLPWFA